MSTLLLLAAMAAWAIGASVIGSRWHGVRPPDLDGYDDHEKIAALRAFLVLHVYLNIRRWRRVIVTGGLVLIVLAWGIAEDQARDEQRERDRQERADQIEADRADREAEAAEQACTIRAESRTEVRAAIVAGVDEIARYAELEPADRDQVVAQVEDRVFSELPPPSC